MKHLKKAGGILLGKTNVPEMCYHSISDNVVYGRTNNPYDLTRIPGGIVAVKRQSSLLLVRPSGSAAILVVASVLLRMSAGLPGSSQLVAEF